MGNSLAEVVVTFNIPTPSSFVLIFPYRVLNIHLYHSRFQSFLISGAYLVAISTFAFNTASVLHAVTMKSFATIALFAAAVSAQTTCESEAVLQSCLNTQEPVQEACDPQDFNCLCPAAKNVYQCFANAGCGNDDRAVGYDNIQKSYCAYVTTTTAAVATATSTTSSSSDSTSTPSATEDTDDDDSTSTGDETESATSTVSAAANSSDEDDTGSGTYLAVNAGGMLAAVAGVIAAVL